MNFFLRFCLGGDDPQSPEVRRRCGVLSGGIGIALNLLLFGGKLLAGIITMTALFSVNLQIAGSNLTVDRGTDTIFTSPPVMALLGNMTLMGRKLVVSFVLVLAVKLALELKGGQGAEYQSVTARAAQFRSGAY